MLSHLRTEAYTAYRDPIYPGGLTNDTKPPTIAGNEAATAAAKERLRSAWVLKEHKA
jgi:hypothetical protein